MREEHVFRPVERPERLLTAGVRPACVWYRNGIVRVDVHDAWYVEECKKYIAAARRLHPDYVRIDGHDGQARTGSGFKAVMTSLKAFQEQQREFYRPLGLEPPHVHFKGLPRRTKIYRRPMTSNFPFPEPELQ